MRNSGTSYREVSDADARATVDSAWAEGIRYFDTAPHYGLGLSERRLGSALAGRPRSDYVVSTKVGRLLEPVDHPAGLDDDGGFAVPATHRRVWDFSRDGIRRSLEESLERLGLDRVDIVYLHDPDDHWDDVIESGYPALAELRDEGVVGAIGAGMNQSRMLADLVRLADVDVVMLAGRYTLLEQDALDDLLPACVARGVCGRRRRASSTAACSRCHARPTTRSTTTPSAPASSSSGRARSRRSANRHGTTLPAAAIAFPLAHPAVVERLCRRPLATADRAQRRPLPAADLSGLSGVSSRRSACSGADAPTPA